MEFGVNYAHKQTGNSDHCVTTPIEVHYNATILTAKAKDKSL